ncbi:response regulator transcription factor [Streptomyces sp. MBT65]|uniref:response regulator transcription factor n=1 Tax=Streptomyces sp. MBT65 TaxID=1488395 RepID=UPI0019099E03|nr:response regulator transcription factor [Streptomyces sp. MBT65]MBK3576349.1 response regulator transcription factor [Streptomyces sp. MBT65]
MAWELERFAAGGERGLPPALVLAPRFDRDDVSQALARGADGYLLAERQPAVLEAALLCTAHGISIIDPVVAAYHVDPEGRAEAVGAGRGQRVSGVLLEGAAGTAAVRPLLSRGEGQVMEPKSGFLVFNR